MVRMTIRIIVIVRYFNTIYSLIVKLAFLSLYAKMKTKQEDLLFLITTLVKLNLFFSTIVVMQCTIQNSPWWLTDDYTHHITWSWMNEKQTRISMKLMKAINKQLSSIIVKIKFVCAVSNGSHAGFTQSDFSAIHS